jgi:ribosomal protein L33
VFQQNSKSELAPFTDAGLQTSSAILVIDKKETATIVCWECGCERYWTVPELPYYKPLQCAECGGEFFLELTTTPPVKSDEAIMDGSSSE